jgi:RHS repeat-associated protein
MQRTSLQNNSSIGSDDEGYSLAYTLNLLVYMQLLKDMKAKLREAAEERETLAETLTREDGNTVNNPNPVQRYQLSNNIESATLELDDTAQIISYEEYYPYGDTSYQAGTNASEVSQKRYRYTGKEKDEESGLYYMLARYYSGWLGRWTAVDPAGLVDGVNLYMYCRGNPVVLLDKDGMRGGTGLYDTVEVKGKSESNIVNGETDYLGGPRGGASGGFKTEESLAPPDKTATSQYVHEPNEIQIKFGTHYNKMYEQLWKIEGGLGELIRAVWYKYEDKLKIEYANYSEKPHLGSRGVLVNIENDSKIAESEGVLPYQTTFHEFAHIIDRFASGNSRTNSYSYRNGNEFGESITREVNQHIETSTNLKNELSEIPMLEGAYLFDIVGGATKNKIDMGYTHYEEGFWENSQNLPKEAFANMFSAAITNPEALDAMSRYLPKSYEIFKNILREMAR